MDSLEQVKTSLNSNTNLPNDIKEKFISLAEIFIRKMPSINLTRLCKNLQTVKVGKLSKFDKKGTYYYDVMENKIQFSDSLEGNYDIDHLFMKAILEMTTSNGSFTGFNSDERLRALNVAYTEILANYIVGNEGDTDFEEEVLITNLISLIVGKDTMYESYFTNNGEPIIKAMQEAEVGLR